MPKERAVEMIDRAGKVIKTYPSLAEAGRDNFMTRQNIMHHCTGLIKFPFENHKYTFRYKE